MPSASRSTTPVGIDLDVVEGRYAELDDHTVSFETFKQDLDVAPYFRGLPGDACTCQHLGYVTAGPDHLPLARPRGDLRRGRRVRRRARPPAADRRRHLDRRVQPDRRPAAGDGDHRPQHRGDGGGRRHDRASTRSRPSTAAWPTWPQSSSPGSRPASGPTAMFADGRVRRPDPPALADAGAGRRRRLPPPRGQPPVPRARSGSRPWTAPRAASCSSSRSAGRPRGSSGTAAS